jgi:hypothetical protein
MRLLPVALLILLLAACGSESPEADEPSDVPITSRAVAAVALEYVPEDTTERGPTYVEPGQEAETVGADLRYDGDGEYDGDLVSVQVTTDLPEVFCEPGDDRCVERAVDGGTLYLLWEEVAPEEDPGVVSVAMVRGEEMVLVGYSGVAIEGDPREQDLPVPVETMEELAQDERLSLTTTQDVVDAGGDVDDWQD